MQNYNKHRRYYIPHHFVFYPVILAGTIYSVFRALHDAENSPVWYCLAFIFLLFGWLSFMLRQHYALTLQDRLVVTEMRYRYYVLTGQRLELLEGQLTFGQIAALRFAPDDELPVLVQRVLKEDLSPDQIKQHIKNWLPDHNRV